MKRLFYPAYLLKLTMTASWYKITNKGSVTDIAIHGEIGAHGVSYKDFITELDAISGDIHLRLNGPGGNMFDGFAMYDALVRKREAGAKLTGMIEGTAASMLSLIALAVPKGNLSMAENGRFMYHRANGGAVGTADDMRNMASLMEAEEGKAIKIYAERSGESEDTIKSNMAETTWLHGSDAKDAGFVDNIVEPIKIAATAWDMKEMSDKYGFAMPEMVDPPKKDKSDKLDTTMKELKSFWETVKADGFIKAIKAYIDTSPEGSVTAETIMASDAVKALMTQWEEKVNGAQTENDALTAKVTTHEATITSLTTDRDALKVKVDAQAASETVVLDKDGNIIADPDAGVDGKSTDPFDQAAEAIAGSLTTIVKSKSQLEKEAAAKADATV